MMKTARIATLVLCIALLVLPSLAIPIFRGSQTDAEYRGLAEFPWLFDIDEGVNRDFAGEFEAWLCDHFALRAQAVRANAQLNYALLRTSVNPDVIVGRDGWFYYAESAPDFTGEGALTDDELAEIVENLSAMAEVLADQGARLYIAVIPNKNTLYPDYMPARYPRRQDGGNIVRLRAACADLPMTWIDLLTPLSKAAQSETPVYYHTDTHWNGLGAALSANVLLRAMGREGFDYAQDGEALYAEGDLARLMGLPGDLTETAPVVAADCPLPEADYSLHELEVSGEGEGRLLLFRDSFGTAVGPYLAQAYESAELRWETPLEPWHPCDDALILIAERNLRLYLSEAPMLSPDEDEWDDEDEAFWDEDDAEFWDEDEAYFDDEDDAFWDDEDEEDDYEMLQRMREEMRAEQDGI